MKTCRLGFVRWRFGICGLDWKAKERTSLVPITACIKKYSTFRMLTRAPSTVLRTPFRPFKTFRSPYSLSKSSFYFKWRFNFCHSNCFQPVDLTSLHLLRSNFAADAAALLILNGVSPDAVTTSGAVEGKWEKCQLLILIYDRKSITMNHSQPFLPGNVAHSMATWFDQFFFNKQNEHKSTHRSGYSGICSQSSTRGKSQER
jgi:hypothetical protein